MACRQGREVPDAASQPANQVIRFRSVDSTGRKASGLRGGEEGFRGSQAGSKVLATKQDVDP